jgi:hypothetical protein
MELVRENRLEDDGKEPFFCGMAFGILLLPLLIRSHSSARWVRLRLPSGIQGSARREGLSPVTSVSEVFFSRNARARK